ncbi:variable surface lipoprotein [Mycoplasmopsis bovis]|nr:variable surface lipoprotein [Mycoplasmopsis bovis]WHL47862.1 variable surface lipoprotein [Mycoplasmopsis bovis]
MKKKIKKLNIFSSLSFLPLMPLVAASCKKNGNNEKVQIINNESDPQTSKQMTPPPLILMVIKAKMIQAM